MRDEIDLVLPNLDGELWEFVDGALTEMVTLGIEVDDRVADAVAALAGQKLAERMGEIGRQWASMRRDVESATVKE